MKTKYYQYKIQWLFWNKRNLIKALELLGFGQGVCYQICVRDSNDISKIHFTYHAVNDSWQSISRTLLNLCKKRNINPLEVCYELVKK